MTRLRHGLVAVALVALASASAPTALASSAGRAHAGPNGQAVVVVGGTAHVVQVGGGITGLSALRAVAGVETLNYGGNLGEAVCKISGVGDEAVPSSCPGGWRYYRAQNGAGGWTYSGAGPSNTMVRPGDVEGWGYNSTPPFRSFCSVAQCAPPPPPPPPPGQGGAIQGGAIPPAGAAGGAGGTRSGAAPGTPGGPGAPGAPGEAGAEGVSGDPTATSAAADTTTGDEKDGTSSRSARTRLTADDSSGPGSPLSLIVFGIVLVALVVGVFAVRRSRRRLATSPSAVDTHDAAEPLDATKPTDASP